MLRPPTTPEAPPTIRISSTGSVDIDAMDDIKKANPSARRLSWNCRDSGIYGGGSK